MNLLNKDPAQIERMGLDLQQKIQAAIDCTPELNMGVHGVFSLDDLERKIENDLGGGIGVGVQYNRSARATLDEQKRPSASSTRYVDFFFSVILAVPAGLDSANQHDATKLLSILRLGILGKPVAGDIGNTRWDFVNEQAEPGASTNTMLYYSQLWQLALPLVAA